MKISYNWLKQYVNIDLDPEKVAELLTDCGLEVEGLEKTETVKGGLEGVVIGEVITKSSHPRADRLSLTTVDIGEKDLLHIVCGAPNVEAGQKVVVAKVGTTLYGFENPLTLKKTKIRGELSEGMICAEDELGLGLSHDGIMVLDADAETGTTAKEYFNIEDDHIFEIGLTPNRTDAMSHIGVARDLVASLNNKNEYYGTRKKLNLKIPSVEDFKADNQNRNFKIIIDDAVACPRYTGLSVSGVEVKPSPGWLKNRLNAIGIRPINNLVDISNYVLFETGQPLHFFDADKIKDDTVIIKKLPAGTKFTTLDEVERELSGEDLMICDAERGMCIAGVFGGAGTGVTEETENLFIESANFDPATLRKTSKYHDLATDASFRFERGADPNITVYAIKRAAMLVKEIAGGEISSDIIDVYPDPVKNCRVDITYRNIDRLAGKKIEKDRIKSILSDLEFDVVEETNESIKVSVPTYRIDVKREADVIEEILRIYGYNNIEIYNSVRSSLSYTTKPDIEKMQNEIAGYLSSNGFSEIWCNSITKSEYSEKLNFIDPYHDVKILNPLSKDLNVMRQSLLPGGLEIIIYNINRRNSDLMLYEFGHTYSLHSDIKDQSNPLNKYKEEMHLSLFLTGKADPESWYYKEKEIDFYYTKAFVNNILKHLRIDAVSQNIPNDSGFFSEGLAYLSGNDIIVEFGNISKAILKYFDISQAVYYADFNWGLILSLLKDRNNKYTLIPKYPEVRRDLALLIEKNVQFSEIEKIAYQTEKQLLKTVNLFDVYESDNIEAGKKSYAVSFILQDETRTLTDKVIDKTMERLIKAYQDQLGAVIR